MKDVVMSYNYISGINQVKRIGKVGKIDKERYHNLMKSGEDVLNYEENDNEYHLLKIGNNLAKLEVGKSGSFLGFLSTNIENANEAYHKYDRFVLEMERELNLQKEHEKMNNFKDKILNTKN